MNKLKLQLTSRGDEVERYKKQANELDEQLQISQERENSTSTKMDKEIRDLRVSLDGYKTELELREKEKSDMESWGVACTQKHACGPFWLQSSSPAAEKSHRI